MRLIATYRMTRNATKILVGRYERKRIFGRISKIGKYKEHVTWTGPDYEAVWDLTV